MNSGGDERPYTDMNRPEQALQRAVVQHLAWRTRPDVLWFHIPNGGLRSKAEAAIMKGLGTKPGVADLAFVLPGGRAAFLELKSGKGVLSEAQKAFRQSCIAAGAGWAMARNIDEALSVLDAWKLLR